MFLLARAKFENTCFSIGLSFVILLLHLEKFALELDSRIIILDKIEFLIHFSQLVNFTKSRVLRIHFKMA